MIAPHGLDSQSRLPEGSRGNGPARPKNRYYLWLRDVHKFEDPEHQRYDWTRSTGKDVEDSSRTQETNRIPNRCLNPRHRNEIGNRRDDVEDRYYHEDAPQAARD